MNTLIRRLLSLVVFDVEKVLSLLLSGILILLFFGSCGDDSHQAPPLFVLKADSGVDFNNQLTPNPELNILTYLYYYNGGGVAAGDFNNDGLVDLYFTGNQVNDRLYLNKGGLAFTDITSAAAIQNDQGWTTGVSLVDINNDGLLDIYVCKVGQFKSISGKNLLFVNEGTDKNGIPVFSEKAGEYGLDIQSFATQSAFFDYDLDGDLDMFLLNHSVYPNRNYGKGNLRKQIDSLAGDKLFRNEAGFFREVSEEAGIYQGRIGYGLGLGISDLNNDGYPDIYVGNDFFENDYLYMNQQDGTFKDLISENEHNLGHTSHFSMGNDIADIDNDGWTDIVSLDMLPQDLQAYKTSGREYNNQIYAQYLKNGYHPQFMQNTLLRNAQGKYFQEIAYASGIAATDWSWGPLIVDLDNDGFKDLFISNGILGATNDMDFINFIANRKIQEQLSKGMDEKDLRFTEQLPQRKLSNAFYKNNADLTFTDVRELWFEDLPSFSNGCTYADLDNDGDQDLIVNNVNSRAFILENRSDTLTNQFIKIKFDGPEKNKLGIGAKIRLISDSLSIAVENFNSRGYLSATPPDLTVGIGPRQKIETIEVTWPDGKFQRLQHIAAGSNLVLEHTAATSKEHFKASSKNVVPDDETVSLSGLTPPFIDFRHQELTSYEFGREPLIPYSKGAEGPKISIADVDRDGLLDVYIGGGKKQAGQLLLQDKQGQFTASNQTDFEKYASAEETDNVFFDADGDGDPDLITVSGGNEYISGQELRPVLYLNDNGKFNSSDTFPVIETNASVVKAADLDNDGDLDLIIGSNAVPRNFGRSSKNYVLYNDGTGNFTDVSKEKAGSFANIGLVEDIDLADLNQDGRIDLVAVGHWMPVCVFMNSEEGFILQQDNRLTYTNGLWNSVRVEDFDKDGDLDLIAGNWGINSRFKASKIEPMRLYINDFDDNGKEEAILTYHEQGARTVFSSKDELVSQLPILNKKFLSYSDFAKADVEQLFDSEKIKKAIVKNVDVLESCYFENDGNLNFQLHPLPFLAQVSSTKSIYLNDFNEDGYMDALLAGNDHAISTQLGRLDATQGMVLVNDQQGSFEVDQFMLPPLQGQVRDIDKIVMHGDQYLVITCNNASPQFILINNKHD